MNLFLTSCLPQDISLRNGSKEDFGVIFSSVLKEKMNPLGIDTKRFIVAESRERGRVAGFGQLRHVNVPSGGAGFLNKVLSSTGLQKNWQGELVELATLYVLQEFRGQGIGSAIVKELLQKAQGKIVCLITVESRTSLYRKLGFREVPPECIPSPLQFEVAAGTVVARFAVNESIVCMAHETAFQKLETKV